ncbi:uncharacterized protein L201_002924 [Kwoniella dendrophila CBS 6074]|uniref:Uncharacterized protein n=1 Tax=Kwoniella dendrophila CBS 6074 TaxID=1295534 RepID=A0AAX4JRF3_9TREE
MRLQEKEEERASFLELSQEWQRLKDQFMKEKEDLESQLKQANLINEALTQDTKRKDKVIGDLTENRNKVIDDLTESKDKLEDELVAIKTALGNDYSTLQAISARFKARLLGNAP